MSDPPLATVARYDTTGDAHLARAQLLDADIPCMLSNEDQAGLSRFFSASRSGVEVKVPEPHADEARAVLASPDTDR